MARIINYTQAIREAQDIEMARDPDVFICGEDVGVFGTAFGQTVGLHKKYGPMRVLDTPLSENGDYEPRCWCRCRRAAPDRCA